MCVVVVIVSMYLFFSVILVDLLLKKATIFKFAKQVSSFSFYIKLQMMVVQFEFSLKKYIVELRCKLSVRRFLNCLNKIQQKHRKVIVIFFKFP